MLLLINLGCLWAVRNKALLWLKPSIILSKGAASSCSCCSSRRGRCGRHWPSSCMSPRLRKKNTSEIQALRDQFDKTSRSIQKGNSIIWSSHGAILVLFVLVLLVALYSFVFTSDVRLFCFGFVCLLCLPCSCNDNDRFNEKYQIFVGLIY